MYYLERVIQSFNEREENPTEHVKSILASVELDRYPRAISAIVREEELSFYMMDESEPPIRDAVRAYVSGALEREAVISQLRSEHNRAEAYLRGQGFTTDCMRAFMDRLQKERKARAVTTNRLKESIRAAKELLKRYEE